MKKKFKKKFLIFLCIILFITNSSLYASFNSPIYEKILYDNNNESEKNMEMVLIDANKYIKEHYLANLGDIGDYYPNSININGTIHKPNYELYQRYNLIIYWSGNDFSKIKGNDYLIAKKGDPNYVKGEKIYRYIGYSSDKEPYFNPFFPHDKYVINDLSPPAEWSSNNNSAWISISTYNKDLRNKLLANVSKSLIKQSDNDMEAFFRYRTEELNLNINELEKYKQSNIKYIKDNFSAETEEKKQFLSKAVKIIALPSENSDGFAAFYKENGYYTQVKLEFENDLNANLEIRHLSLEKNSENKYSLSKKTSYIDSVGKIIKIKQGESKEFQARKSSSFDYLGYQIYKNEDEYLKKVGNRENPKEINSSSLISSETATYTHEYEIDKEKPILVFFYIENDNFDFESMNADGSIEISSDKYNVSNAIPSDKKVKITANVDSRALVAYDIQEVEEEINIDVYKMSKRTVIFANGGAAVYTFKSYIDTLKIPYKYNKLYSHSIYHLNSVDVFNPKLKKTDPINLKAKGIMPSSAKSYTDGERLHCIIPSGFGGARLYLTNLENGNYEIIADVGFNSNYFGSEWKRNLYAFLSQNTVLELKNDYLKVDGQVILDDTIFNNDDDVPELNSFHRTPTSLIKNDHLIDVLIKNGNSKTNGFLRYNKVSGKGDDNIKFEIQGNNVFVHTPSLNRTIINKNPDYDQRTNRKKIGTAIPLDRVMKLDLFTDGNHINEKGYRTRDYEEHIREKTVKFDFDVYVSINKDSLKESLPDTKYFAKSRKILKFPANVKSIYYKAAPWAKEGEHKIFTLAIAKNSPLRLTAEEYANFDYNNYAAFQEKTVYLTPRVYGFSIEKVFDPAYLSDKSDFTLPVTIGKSTLDKKVNRFVKMGYPFVFSLKTMGTFYSENDIVSAKPRFYHLDENRNINENIVLYYRNKGKLVKIDDDKEYLKQNLVIKDIANTNDFLDISVTKMALIEKSGKDDVCNYMKYWQKISKPVFCYKPSLFILSYPMRTFAGFTENIPASVDKTDALMSVQKWKGMYSLPKSTMAFTVDENGNIDLDKPIKKGAIGVIFDIQVSRNRNLDGEEIKYESDLSNQYINDGYVEKQNGISYLTGTSILYSLENRADEDLNIE